jgi:hypothetical protein
MNDNRSKTSLLARRLPSLSEVADRLAVVVKNVWAIGTPVLVRSLNNSEERTAQRLARRIKERGYQVEIRKAA